MYHDCDLEILLLMILNCSFIFPLHFLLCYCYEVKLELVLSWNYVTLYIQNLFARISAPSHSGSPEAFLLQFLFLVSFLFMLLASGVFLSSRTFKT